MKRTDMAECQWSIADLGDNAAPLTGFTRRAIAALAHLREAWLVADNTNRPAIEAAIHILIRARSLTEGVHREIVREILSQGMPGDDDLWTLVAP